MFFSIALLLSHTGYLDSNFVNVSSDPGKPANYGYLEGKSEKFEDEENQEDVILVSSLGKKSEKSSKKNPAAVGKLSFAADKQESNYEEPKEEREDETDNELAKERLQILAFSIAEEIGSLKQVSSLKDFAD